MVEISTRAYPYVWQIANGRSPDGGPRDHVTTIPAADRDLLPEIAEVFGNTFELGCTMLPTHRSAKAALLNYIATKPSFTTPDHQKSVIDLTRRTFDDTAEGWRDLLHSLGMACPWTVVVVVDGQPEPEFTSLVATYDFRLVVLS